MTTIHSARLETDAVEKIQKQIRMQQKAIIWFPFAYILLFFLAFGRNGGHLPDWYFYPISLVFLVIPFFIMPLFFALKLRRVIYRVEATTDNAAQFTLFGALWRNEEILFAGIDDISIDPRPSRGLLFRKYALRRMTIDGSKYFIFESVAKESGLTQ